MLSEGAKFLSRWLVKSVCEAECAAVCLLRAPAAVGAGRRVSARVGRRRRRSAGVGRRRPASGRSGAGGSVGAPPVSSIMYKRLIKVTRASDAAAALTLDIVISL